MCACVCQHVTSVDKRTSGQACHWFTYKGTETALPNSISQPANVWNYVYELIWGRGGGGGRTV